MNDLNKGSFWQKLFCMQNPRSVDPHVHLGIQIRILMNLRKKIVTVVPLIGELQGQAKINCHIQPLA